jgi:hypothetical protein
MLDDERTPYPGSFQQLADARRALKVVNSLNKHPVLEADERLVLQRVKALAIRCIGAAVEVLVDTLDLLDGDTDAEDATGAEDAFEDHNERFGYDGPGCPVADPSNDSEEDSAVDDRPCDDINMDLEPDHDAEVETWSHPDDHPAKLFVCRRPEPPEAA